MRFEFKLPDIGEGVVEGEVVKWLVNDGDQVAAEQPVVEVMTDKATVVIPSPKAGKVLERKGKEGDMIKVHSTLLVLDAEGAAGATAPAAAPAPTPAAAPVAKVAAAAPPAAPKMAAAAPAVAAARPNPTLRAVPPPSNGDAHVRATPVTRKLAADAGIDLATVAGSGPAGRVLKSDVLAIVGDGGDGGNGATGAAQAPAAPRRAPAGGEERIPLRGLRKRIAENMQRSKRTAAHFTFVEEVDCTRLVEMRKRINEALAKQPNGGKLSYLPFIVKATVAALRRFPTLNASVDDEAHELVVKHFFNLGIAAATPDGLIVPVLHGADSLSLKEIAAEVGRLAADAKAGKSKLEDLKGGTFTITSLGEIGGLFATPVINHPEVAILGVHRMRPTPRVVNGQIVVRDVLWLSCSFDHRVIDGAVGAQFTYEIIKYLEDPELLMLELA